MSTRLSKVVCYASTRNLYPYLPTAISSLLSNNPGIQKVYVFCEDDEIESLLDCRIECVNVRNEDKFLWNHSASYDSCFTYMALMRMAFSKYLPDVSKCLYLDVDTIVDGNIENLFDIDMTDSAVAGVEDTCSTDHKNPYINTGVLLMNLDYIRDNEVDSKWLELINSKNHYKFPDQDVINAVCTDCKLTIPRMYNKFCHMEGDAKIIHFAGFRKFWEQTVPGNDIYRKYRCWNV